jgi:hypothetical protein
MDYSAICFGSIRWSGVFGRFDLVALRGGCHTLNVCLFVCLLDKR